LTGTRATRLFRLSLAFACACGAGCALFQPPSTKAEAALLPGEVRSAQAANDTVFIGKSTKADVRAALGEPVMIPFDSGYEVWVYRQKEKPQDTAPRPRTELVLLFGPSGIVSKTRIR
jgi:outer membrane protein assembly factor BamE (lipoprotein component of BamABCDE complex)